MGFPGCLLFLYLTIVIPQKGQSTDAVYDVTCSPKLMKVTIFFNSSETLVYLERLKGYSGCQPEMSDNQATFNLSLSDIYKCGTTKMINKITGQKIYYHRLILEHLNSQKEMILVRCVIQEEHRKALINNLRNRRDTLSKDFYEPELANITDYTEAHAAIPYLSLALRQDGRFLDTTRNVQPGTPLEIIIFPDKESAASYGLLTSYMKVTDNASGREEIMVMNGCSIDPYIFGNFEGIDNGNMLSAKLTAFKFPNSDYVLFVGVVEVCLQRCQEVPCGDDIYGFGRKKREIPDELPEDSNRVFEVEMTAFLKVERNYKYSPSKDYEMEENDAAIADKMTHASGSSRSPLPTYLTVVLCSFTLLVY